MSMEVFYLKKSLNKCISFFIKKIGFELNKILPSNFESTKHLDNTVNYKLDNTYFSKSEHRINKAHTYNLAPRNVKN